MDSTTTMEPETSTNGTGSDGDASRVGTAQLDTTTIGAPADADQTTRAPHAVIYFPGMSGDPNGDEAIALARRIERAYNRSTETVSHTFSTAMRDAEFGDQRRIRVSTILRTKAATNGTLPTAEPVLDIYHFDYRSILRGEFERTSLVLKLFLVLLTTIVATLRVAKRIPGSLIPFRGNPITRTDQWQIIYALGILACFFVYLGILGVAAWQSLSNLIDANVGGGSTASGHDWGWWQSLVDWINSGAIWTFPNGGVVALWNELFSPVIEWIADEVIAPVGAETAIILSVVLTLLIPRFGQLRDRMGEVAVDFVTVIHYLQLGQRRNVIHGHIRDLLEIVTSNLKHPEHANKAHVIAYSFGTVVAIDALFPYANPPSRRFGAIQSLTTIGCPFDMVRSYWPDYFTQRRRLDNVPPQWINVHCPTDVLSSNFRDDAHLTKAPDRGMNLTSSGGGVGLMDRITSFVTDSNTPDATPDPPIMPSVNVLFMWGEKKRLSIFDAFTLLGFRAHTMYWERGDESGYTAFDEVITRILDETDLK